MAHGDHYDYSQTHYFKMHASVTIICPEHGEFRQIAQSHVNGHGCKKCSYTDRTARKYLTLPEVIERFEGQHGSRYDYQSVVYAGTKEKVHIICREHGSFWQQVSNHMKGHGCPICGEVSRLDAPGPCTLYYARVDCPTGPVWKVGVTSQKDVRDRFNGILKEFPVTILHEDPFESRKMAVEREQAILRHHEKDRIIGPWSGTSGATECFRRDILGMDPYT